MLGRGSDASGERRRARAAGQGTDRNGPGGGQSRQRLVLKVDRPLGTLPRMTTITLTPADLRHFRFMLREQLAGDHELMREIADGVQVAPHLSASETEARLALVDRLAAEVGGLY